MIILLEQVLASAHIAENRWIPDLIFAQDAEKIAGLVQKIKFTKKSQKY